jgi:hypothetical protein
MEKTLADQLQDVYRSVLTAESQARRAVEKGIADDVFPSAVMLLGSLADAHVAAELLLETAKRHEEVPGYRQGQEE